MGFKSIFSLLLKPIDFEMPWQPYSKSPSLSMSSLSQKFTRKRVQITCSSCLLSWKLGHCLGIQLVPWFTGITTAITWHQCIHIAVLDRSILEHLCLGNYFLCSYLSINTMASSQHQGPGEADTKKNNKKYNKTKIWRVPLLSLKGWSQMKRSESHHFSLDSGTSRFGFTCHLYVG